MVNMTGRNKSLKTPKVIKSNSSVNLDGFANLLTGLGMPGSDKSVGTFFKPDCKIPPEQLDFLYSGDGLTKTIVQIVPEQMLSKGFVVEGDAEGYVKSRLETLNGLEKITEMMYWGRLYGGGIIVMGLDDYRELWEPVDLTTLRNVNFLHVFDRYQVNQGTQPTIDLDMSSSNYGLPVEYNIRFNAGNGAYEYITVHHSRILRVDGISLPSRLKSMNQYWGESEIQACYREIKAYSSTFGNIASLIHSFVIPVFGIKGLSDSLNCGAESQVATRIAMANIAMSNLNMLVKDTEETFEKVSTPLAGVSEILDRFMMTVSSVTRIPVALLFGRSAGGLNSTGEHDTNAFYDFIIQQQEKKLKPVLEKLIRYIMLSKDGDFNGIEPENWTIVFNPLIENSPTDEANYRRTIAEIDEKYINLGVLEPHEVRNSRFGSGVYSDLITLDDEVELQEEYAEQGNLENREAMIELFRKVDSVNGKEKT